MPVPPCLSSFPAGKGRLRLKHTLQKAQNFLRASSVSIFSEERKTAAKTRRCFFAMEKANFIFLSSVHLSVRRLAFWEIQAPPLCAKDHFPISIQINGREGFQSHAEQTDIRAALLKALFNTDAAARRRRNSALISLLKPISI